MPPRRCGSQLRHGQAGLIGYDVDKKSRRIQIIFIIHAPIFPALYPSIIFEGKLYIQTGKKKDVSKQLHANPKAEICAFKGGEWIRVAGELVEDDRIEARQSMLDAYPGLKKMYTADDGNTEVFYFKNGVATISAFTHEPKVIIF